MIAYPTSQPGEIFAHVQEVTCFIATLFAIEREVRRKKLNPKQRSRVINSSDLNNGVLCSN